MSINFPNNPALGDEYTDQNRNIWIWYNNRWRRKVPSYGPAAIDIHRLRDFGLDVTGGPDGAKTTFELFSQKINRPVSPLSIEQVAIFKDGNRLEPGTDYTVSGTHVTFTNPPAATDRYFAQYYAVPPGAAGGVDAPLDTSFLQRFVYDPVAPGGGAMMWADGRSQLQIVDQIADLNNRVKLPAAHLEQGSIVLVTATGQLFRMLKQSGRMGNVASDWKLVSGAGGVKYVPRVTGLPTAKTRPKVENGALYVVNMDFEGKPYYRLVSWDASIRGAPAKTTVAALAYDPLDVIHTATELSTIFTNGNTSAGRWYYLDAPNGFTPQPGEPYAGVHLPGGTKLFDCGDPQKGKGGWVVAPPDANYAPGATPTQPSPQVVDDLTQPGEDGGWRFLNRESYVNPLAANSDHPLDNQKGDFQTATENNAKVIKVYDGNTWVTLFDEVQIKGWIASLALFRGTASEDPTQHPGTVTWADLPDLPVLSAAQDKGEVGRYWIWAGQDPFTVSRGTAATGPTHAQSRQGVAIDLGNAVTDNATIAQRLSTDPKPAQWHGFPVSAAFTPAPGRPFAGTALAAGDGLFWTGATGFSHDDATNNVAYKNGWALIKNYTPGDRLVIDATTRTALNAAIDGLPAAAAVNATPKIGADLDGAVLHVGDWLVIADQGNGIAGNAKEVDLHWVRVGGDLLTKSRGTNLFGLKNWADGVWEKDSLVVRSGSVYRARTAIVGGDLAPDAGASALPAGTVVPVAGVRAVNDVPGQQINDQTEFEQFCITAAPPPQWQAYPIAQDFNVAGAPNGFFDGETMTHGERMVWTGFPNLTVADAANQINIVNGWLHDPGTVTMAGGQTATMVSAQTLAAIQQLLPVVKWDKVPISGALKFLTDENNLPPVGRIGDSFLILVSPTYGNNNPAIVTWDAGAATWVTVSGGGAGGTPMDFTQADPLVNMGVPVGTIVMWATVPSTVPVGWLELNGQAFDATKYPELAVLFPGGRVPDLRNNFVRMWGPGRALNLQRKQWTTGRPRHPMVTTTDGQHQHTGGFSQDHNNWRSGGGGGPHLGWGVNTGRDGQHHHTITGGGDPETAPDHVVLGFIIKAGEGYASLRTTP